MTHWQKSLISVIFLFVMLAFGYRQTLAPEIRTDTDLDFKAVQQHVSVIAKKPHPMGGAANGDIRDYIVDHFESLGLETEVQKTTVVYRHPTRPNRATIIGSVENVIARLPGRQTGSQAAAADGYKDLVVMAHYDSRPLTPGAGDAASATASVLETARIMAVGPALVHDVIFLITDGEEMGLLGAQGYFRQHPSAQNVGLVLNFEARGSYGASFMFETSGNNDWLVDELIASTPDLVASSLSYEIYRQMPNDTDMSISKGEGIPGLNFAFSAGLFDYHAMTDTPENLDKNTLSHQANYVLATARHFARLENWQTGEGDQTYFNLWHGTLVSYSQGVAIAVGLAVLLLGVWLFVSARRSGLVQWGALGTGFLGVLILFLMLYSIFENLIIYLQSADAGIMRLTSLGEFPFLAFFITVLGLTSWFAYRFRQGLGKYDAVLPALVLVALALLAGRDSAFAFVLPLLVVVLMVVVHGRASRPDLFTAALCFWWLLAAMVLYAAPNASYLFVWPLASVLIGIMVARRLNKSGHERVLFMSALVFSFVPLLLLTPVLILGYLALGLGLPQILMILCTLTLLVLWPLTRNIGYLAGGKFGLLLLGAGVVMTLFVLFGTSFDSRHPRGEELFYAIDVDQQQGFWVSSDAMPGTWLGKFMGGDASKANMSHIMPGYDQEILTRKDALLPFEAAQLNVNSDRMQGDVREVRMHLRSPLAAEYVNLLLPVDAGITAVEVNGFPVEVPVEASPVDGEAESTAAQNWWRLRWYGLPRNGADVLIRQNAGHSLPVKIIEVDYGMPPGAPPRPQHSMSRKYTWSDSTVIFQTIILE